MSEMLRPLELGELLDRVFGLYRKYFLLFTGIALLPHLVLLAANLAFSATVLSKPFSLPTLTAMTSGMLAAFIGAEAASVVLAIVVLAITTGATVLAVAGIYLVRPIGIGAALAKVRGLVGKLVATSVLFGLAVFGAVGVLFAVAAALLIPQIRVAGTAGKIGMVLGFMVLIFAALVLAVVIALRYAMAFPAATLETGGAGAALHRSAVLTQGFRGRIFLVWLLFAAIQGAATSALGLAIAGAGVAAGGLQHLFTVVQFGSLCAGFLVDVLVAPMMTIALAVLYFDLKVRKEGFDLQVLLQQAETAPA